MNEEFKHSLSGLLYNMHFGSYEEENDFSHSKKGQTWKKHKYIRKENGRYVYPKGTSGLNTKRQKASRYKWDNRYNTEASKYNATTIGKVKMYKRPDGTVVVTYPGYNAWTLPPGTNTNALGTRLKNLSNTYKESGSNEAEARNNFTKALEGAISGSGSSGTPTSSSSATPIQNQEAPKQETPKQETPKQETPKQETPKQETYTPRLYNPPEWYKKKNAAQQEAIDEYVIYLENGLKYFNEEWAKHDEIYNQIQNSLGSPKFDKLYDEWVDDANRINNEAQTFGKEVENYTLAIFENGVMSDDEVMYIMNRLGIS